MWATLSDRLEHLATDRRREKASPLDDLADVTVPVVLPVPLDAGPASRDPGIGLLSRHASLLSADDNG